MKTGHFTQFSNEWWNERRCRDYYIDYDGYVKLKPDSETGIKTNIALRVEAMKIAAELALKIGRD